MRVVVGAAEECQRLIVAHSARVKNADAVIDARMEHLLRYNRRLLSGLVGVDELNRVRVRLAQAEETQVLDGSQTRRSALSYVCQLNNDTDQLQIGSVKRQKIAGTLHFEVDGYMTAQLGSIAGNDGQ